MAKPKSKGWPIAERAEDMRQFEQQEAAMKRMRKLGEELAKKVRG